MLTRALEKASTGQFLTIFAWGVFWEAFGGGSFFVNCCYTSDGSILDKEHPPLEAIRCACVRDAILNIRFKRYNALARLTAILATMHPDH